MSFFVVLPSNTPSFHDNKTGDYRVILPKPLKFEVPYVCGLHSIVYPYSWSVLGGMSDQFIKIFTDKGEFKIDVSKGSFKNIQELLNSLNKTLDNLYKKYPNRKKRNTSKNTKKVSKRFRRNIELDENESVESDQDDNEEIKVLDVPSSKPAPNLKPSTTVPPLTPSTTVPPLAPSTTVPPLTPSTTVPPLAPSTTVPPSKSASTQKPPTNQQSEKTKELPKSTQAPITIPPAQKDTVQSPPINQQPIENEKSDEKLENPEVYVQTVQPTQKDNVQEKPQTQPAENEKYDEKLENPEIYVSNDFYDQQLKELALQLKDGILKFEFDPLTQRVQVKIIDTIKHIEFSDQLAYTLGFSVGQKIMNGNKANYSYDLTGGISNLLVYCEGLTEPIIVGDKMSPLLRLLTVKGEVGQVIEQIFESPIFAPVVAREISQLHVKIMTMNGRIVPFDWGVSVVTLLFKRSILY